MIRRVIAWSVHNRFIVLLLTGALALGGIWAVRTIPLEALPDLSDVQVIVQADFNEQAPRIVEDQVTYPIAAEMLKVPGARTVRGYSFFGVSFVYVIFEDGTDLYWARTRVLEYLSGLRSKLPSAVSPTLGPDATGLGWVYSVCARGHERAVGPGRTSQRAGLVSPIRAHCGAGSGRSRERRRV